MLLSEVITEYLYDCQSKNFTEKTMKNKRLELKNFKLFIEEKRGITELESITPHDVRAYLRYKQNQGLQPQSVVSLYKMVRAFLNWCEYEEYVEVSPSKKIKPPIAKPKALKGFTANEVQNMIQSFSYEKISPDWFVLFGGI